MLVVANHLTVADGYEGEFIESFEAQAGQIRNRQGLHRVEILQRNETNQYVIVAYWESREAFEDWRNSDDFRRAHANIPREMFSGSNRLETYQRVAKIEMD